MPSNQVLNTTRAMAEARNKQRSPGPLPYVQREIQIIKSPRTLELEERVNSAVSQVGVSDGWALFEEGLHILKVN